MSDNQTTHDGSADLVDVPGLLVQGGMHLAPYFDSPTAGRTVKEALAFWDERIGAALSTAGATVVRIVGDMAYVKASFATVHQMLIFERLVGAIIKRSPSVAICQYDVREFDGPCVLEAIKAHPDVSDLGFLKWVS